MNRTEPEICIPSNAQMEKYGLRMPHQITNRYERFFELISFIFVHTFLNNIDL